MKRSADWLAWSLQLIVGLAVGGVIGLRVISRGRYNPGFSLATEHVPLFLWGAAMVGGGLASYFGDKLWIGDSYRVIPPDAPQNSPASRALSVFIGLLGGGWILLACYRQLGLSVLP